MALDDLAQPRGRGVRVAGFEHELRRRIAVVALARLELIGAVEQLDRPLRVAGLRAQRGEPRVGARARGVELERALERLARVAVARERGEHEPAQLEQARALRGALERAVDLRERGAGALRARSRGRPPAASSVDRVGIGEIGAALLGDRERARGTGDARFERRCARAARRCAKPRCSSVSIDLRARSSWPSSVHARAAIAYGSGCCTPPRPESACCANATASLVLRALEVDARELERRVGLGVVGAHRFAQLRDRAIPVAEVARGEPGEEARGGVVRPRAQTLLELRERAGRVALRQQDPPAQELCVVGARRARRPPRCARSNSPMSISASASMKRTRSSPPPVSLTTSSIAASARCGSRARAVERREQVPGAGRFEAVDRLEQHLLGLVGLIDRLQPRGETLAQVEALGRRRDRVAPQARCRARGRRRCRRSPTRWLSHHRVGGLALAQSS